MLHFNAISNFDPALGGKHFFLSDSSEISEVLSSDRLEALLNSEEVSFFGSFSVSLHDQMDDFIIHKNAGDPLTNFFTDEDGLIEYIGEIASDAQAVCIWFEPQFIETTQRIENQVHL